MSLLKKVKWSLYLLFIFLRFAHAEIIVNTKSGPVRGSTSLSEDVTAFLGIPFAEPPIDNLRFAKPIPKKPWVEVYNATSCAPPCAQFELEPYYFMPDVTNMSEDCLYLNLWVPKSEYIQGLRPVVIFIHGGAFISGSACLKTYDGSKLASRGDIIVATINYRLGAFGFFFGHHEEAPGNMGLYDQIMAIKWVKDNAEIFGGDPNNIVLMGESAGAVSITLLIVSPLAKNLFSRAIIESSSAINPFFFDKNERIEKHSRTFVSMLGCVNSTVNLSTSPRSVIDCLKLKPKEEIIEAERIIGKTNPLTFYPREKDEVLPQSALDLYRNGKFQKNISVLAGINRDEGTLMMVIGLPEYFGYYGQNGSESMSKSRAVAFAKGQLLYTAQPNASEVIEFYVKQVKKRNSNGYIKMLADLIGDFAVSCATVFLADLLSLKGNQVYFYKFEFRAASTPMAEWVGVTHIDELQYVFGNPFHENFTDEETEMSYLIMDRWAAFAKTGNPNLPNHLPWLRYSYHYKLYLNFGQEEETIRMNPNSRCEIWRNRFGSNIDPPTIRFLRNSGMNTTIQ